MKNNSTLRSLAYSISYMGIIFYLGLASCAAQVEAAEKEEKVEPPAAARKGSLLGLAAKAVMGKQGGDKLFYMPMKSTGRTPAKYGMPFEDVFFESADKTKLHGWFLPAKAGIKAAKGTIVFSHGNSGEVSYHLGFVYRMIEGGYNVLLYDYRGFGKSEGEAEKEGVISDAVAAFRYIKTRKDIDQSKIISIGHSLGGAKSIAALTEFQPKGLRAIVVMNTFSSYRKMALKLAGKAASYVVTDTYNPADLANKLPAIPFLVVCAEQDQLIPFKHGEEIYQAANQPKTLMKLKSGGHNNFLAVNKGENLKKLLKWLDNSVK